jgi:hypothetical protein
MERNQELNIEGYRLDLEIYVSWSKKTSATVIPAIYVS